MARDVFNAGDVVTAPRQQTENYLKRTHRDRLPPGYPDDLASDSTPATGSIGDKSMPITNRPAPFALKGNR